MAARAGDSRRTWRRRARATRIDRDANGLHVRPEHSETLDVDIVISATGVRPNIGFLSGSGVAAQRGILVDDAMRASVENVYAAGDRRQP
jgi:phenylglyoxylate dehydrogenase epsilon subunit